MTMELLISTMPPLSRSTRQGSWNNRWQQTILNTKIKVAGTVLYSTCYFYNILLICSLYIEAEEYNVSVLHNILFTLAADKTLLLGGGH